MKLSEYIEDNLPKCIRSNSKDTGGLIGLPYPYIVPCAAGTFQQMFYWDTYFSNRGLLLRGNIEQARNNVDNMCYLINKYGFMPNANHTYFLYSSQPPFLALMVNEVYAVTKDKKWLSHAYDALIKEQKFWEDHRKTENGLNRYDGTTFDKELVRNPNELRERIGKDVVISSDEESVRGLLSAGESGWDLNPRMGAYSYHYTPADLNSLLYALEERLGFFAEELGKTEEANNWNRLSKERAEKCRSYLKNEEGFFVDYNTVTKERNTVFSVASFYPLFCGMASETEAETVRQELPRLETEYGILTCEKNEIPGNYQWDYPNGWAPMQLIVVDSLLRYGYQLDALRIAKKFVNLVERCYEQTRHLWEKYNVVEGNANAVNEYEMPAMMGWTFGVYTYLKKLLQA